MTEEIKKRLETCIVQISCETCRHWTQKPPSRACRVCIRNRTSDLGDMWEPSEGLEEHLAKWQRETMERGGMPEERNEPAEDYLSRSTGNARAGDGRIPEGNMYTAIRMDGQLAGNIGYNWKG